MTLTQVWGALVIFVICPLLGGLPLIAWITAALTRRQLSLLGTGNISVSAAFYHGGRLVGVLAVLSEAAKGIGAVLLARAFFPMGSVWELVALIALVVGRYWFGKGAGTTNVVWGYFVHDPIAAGLVFLISSIGFTIWRERRQGKLAVLVIFPLITALRHPQAPDLLMAAALLAFLLGWIYQKIPDDLNLSPAAAQSDAQSTFKFFRSDRAVPTLDRPLKMSQVGQKAATLSRLKRLGYPVPPGWVLVPGDDPEPLLALLQPSPRNPLVVRSSAIGEDSETASAAGQYETVLSITSREQLMPAISRCLTSYDAPAAVRYRRERGVPDASMAVLIQKQVRGVFSGVAFSRDPIARQGDAVVIEALPGSAAQVVSGQVTPESYQVLLPASTMPSHGSETADWQLPDTITLTVVGQGETPKRLLEQVAWLARYLEMQHQGVPQDVEWSYDGKMLWLLQSRPITTLLPVWTRKIAAEVIPGLIHPLTWSINRPLTCGVWGDLFTIVLGKRARGLDFNETATLHFSQAYFNATLLGNIFQRMGLPPESLEFLTRGAAFSRPPLRSTLYNTPRLLRLARREWQLAKDFQQAYRRQFAPALATFANQPVTALEPSDLLVRIDRILSLLQSATYFSILAPLSAALRKGLAKVGEDQLDNSDTPEVAVLRSLQALARSAHQLLTATDPSLASLENPLESLSKTSAGSTLLAQFNELLAEYGYLSEVGTDIAVPTWREDPHPVQALFVQFCQNPPADVAVPVRSHPPQWVQRRVALKGKVTVVYSRLLAELRWSFVALAQRWLEHGLLTALDDIFLLEWQEIQQLGDGKREPMQPVIAQRRSRLEQDRQLEMVPFLVYGNDPPAPMPSSYNWQSAQQLQGIGASPGQVEGVVKVIRSLTNLPEINREMILVVPYTDSGWAPLLASAGGLIAEVGGRLSHGAIVAREYRIPAVMDIQNATQLLQDGQHVRIDGQQGIVEVL